MARILIVTTVPETLATILRGQPSYLAKHFDVHLATSPGEWTSQVAHNEGLAIHLVPMKRGISVFSDLISLFRMARVLLRVQPQIVHSFTPKAGLVTMLAARLCGIPVRVHTFTGLLFPTAHGLRKKLLVYADQLICANATHLIPEGLGVKKDLEKFHITQKPLQVIGHGNIAGVDTAYFSSSNSCVVQSAVDLRKRLNLVADDFLFCFVGRINIDKGLAELQQAFSLLPVSAHLAVFGELDQSAPVDAATLAALRSHPRVHLMGFVSDIRPVLCAASVLVLPSYREGFPNVLLEGGAMALPAIASDINGCNEVIEPGYNGWLVPSHDMQSLAKTMREAMLTPANLLRAMGQQARVRIKHRFERQQHWERMVLFYQGLQLPAKRET